MAAQAHCVVLQLPLKLCTARATARRNHEGGVEPDQAKAVVGRMASQLKWPSASEGVSSIMVPPPPPPPSLATSLHSPGSLLCYSISDSVWANDWRVVDILSGQARTIITHGKLQQGAVWLIGGMGA